MTHARPPRRCPPRWRAAAWAAALLPLIAACDPVNSPKSPPTPNPKTAAIAAAAGASVALPRLGT